MADLSYLYGRSKYARPQAILWSDNPGRLELVGEDQYTYVPNGYEINSTPPESATDAELNQFLILSDHNRSAIDIKYDRIENRQRTVNGTMRSRFIADKLSLNFSWNLLPSKSYSSTANYDPITGKSSLYNSQSEFTADGGAGGNDILDWYDSHQGPFWVFLSYDKIDSTQSDAVKFQNFPNYNQVLEMYISDFSYTIEKRSGTLYDMWNISVSLEEV